MVEQNFLIQDASLTVSANVADGVQRVISLAGNRVFYDGMSSPMLHENVNVIIYSSPLDNDNLGTMHGRLLIDDNDEGSIDINASLHLPPEMFEDIARMAQFYISGMNELSMTAQFDVPDNLFDEEWFTKVGPHVLGAKSKEMKVDSIDFFHSKGGRYSFPVAPGERKRINF